MTAGHDQLTHEVAGALKITEAAAAARISELADAELAEARVGA